MTRPKRRVRAKPVRVLSWPARIAAARKRGSFTSREGELAQAWPTCACGKLDAAIPRGRANLDSLKAAPTDNKLFDLGALFVRYVVMNDFNAAESTIRAITKRAAEVLKENAK